MTRLLFRRGGLAQVLAGLALTAPFFALAQVAGDKPIRIMVGASPGGGADILARMLADKFAPSLKAE